MSLMKTLAKVAIGVAVAKGASSMMKKGGGASQPGLGGLLGGLAGGAQGGSSGSLQDMLGGLTGGGAGQAGAGSLQDMLGGLLGGAAAPGSAAAPGGLGGLLDAIGGGSGGAGPALGGLAGKLGGAGGVLGGLAGALANKPKVSQASFGKVLNSQFDQTPDTPITPSADQEAAAALMLRAMIQAAKSDGKLDAAEEEKLVGHLGGDVDAEEAAFVRAEMQRPVDAAALAAEVPGGMGPQVYMMSVLGIDLDSQAEAKYLHSLAQGLGLQPAQVNEIHAQLGVPSLYT